MIEPSTLADLIETLAEQDLGGASRNLAVPADDSTQQSPPSRIFGFKYESETIVIYAGQADP